MTGEGFFSFIETGSHALLVTLALVAAYIILRRMARQMRKGVDIATRQSIQRLEMQWNEEGRLRVQIELSTGANGTLTIHFEGSESGEKQSPIEVAVLASPLVQEFNVPAGAHGIVIATDSERIYRRLPEMG